MCELTTLLAPMTAPSSILAPAMMTHSEGVLLFYEFFRSRYVQSLARKLGKQPGPKRTAEGYAMVYFLEQMT